MPAFRPCTNLTSSLSKYPFEPSRTSRSSKDSAPRLLLPSRRWQYPLTCRGNQGYVEFMAPSLELDSGGRPPPFLPPIQDRPIDVLFSGCGFRVLLPRCSRLRDFAQARLFHVRCFFQHLRFSTKAASRCVRACRTLFLWQGQERKGREGKECCELLWAAASRPAEGYPCG